MPYFDKKKDRRKTSLF